MQSFYQHFLGNTVAAPVIFLVLFLVIVGGALAITPRLAAWLDRRSSKHRGYYDGMLTEDPTKKEEDDESDGTA